MKKTNCLLLVVVLSLTILTACDFTTNVSNSFGQMQGQEKVDSMLSALSSGDASAAKALLHPDVSAENAQTLVQLQEYLNGRKVTDLKREGWSVSTSTVPFGGTIRQEKASFQAALDDGTVFHLSVCYVTEDQAQGFTAFQFVLGIV